MVTATKTQTIEVHLLQGQANILTNFKDRILAVVAGTGSGKTMTGYKCPLCGREVWRTYRCNRCQRQVCAHCIVYKKEIPQQICVECDKKEE